MKLLMMTFIVESWSGEADFTLECDANFVLDHGDCIIDMSVDGDWIVTGGSDAR